MENKVNIYARINSDVRDRATLYITQSKLVKSKTDTLGKLIEEALDDYMIKNPI